MTLYIISGILLLGLVLYLIYRPKTNSVLEDFFISTQTQSNARVKNLNLDKPSEDASFILDTSRLSFPDVEINLENVEYKADSEREWIIDLIPVHGDVFKKEDFTKLFDYEWRSNFKSTIYGFSTEENRWTYADAGGTPEIYSKLQVAIDIQEVFNDEKPNYDTNKLERYIIELEKRITKYPTKLRLEYKETIESVIKRAERLVSLYHEFNYDAIIILQSDKQFNGMEMWDVLQSVGLSWGDGDLFHWSNNKNYGDGQHFSVWTTTEPGYFLPEEVRDGNMNPKTLVFGFIVPRSADPKNIFDMMLSAVKYSQKRLGGQILDRNMQPFDETKEVKHINEITSKMDSRSIRAGSENALRMF